MKIVFCLNHFLPQQVGGTEIYVHSLAKALHSCGHHVHIVIPNAEKSEHFDYVFDGLDVHQYAEPTIKTQEIFNGTKPPDGLINFAKFMKECAPDVVHIHEVSGSAGIGLFHYKCLTALNIPVITTLHVAGYSCSTGTLLYKNRTPCSGYIDVLRCSTCVYATDKRFKAGKRFFLPLAGILWKAGIDPNAWKSKPGTALGVPFQVERRKKNLHSIAHYSHKVCTVAQWYLEVLQLNDIAPAKLEFVQQALPGKLPAQVKKHAVAPTLKIIFVGRVTPEKGLHLLIHAMAKFNQSKLCLDIYGQQSDLGYATQLKSVAKEIKVNFLGRIQPADMIATMQQYDLLCLPSVICEMSPLVIQEAYAAGIAVLVSDVKGNIEQVKGKAKSWVFAHNDADDLVKKLELILSESRNLDAQDFNADGLKSFDDVAAKYGSIYQSAVQTL